MRQTITHTADDHATVFGLLARFRMLGLLVTEMRPFPC